MDDSTGMGHASSRTVEADVVVCGGGVAGTMAAVAAARQGASVVLVERYGFLGGNATAGAVAQFNSWQTGNGRTVVAGLADEVVARLRLYGAARAHERFMMSTGHHMDRVEYAPEVLKLVLDDMVAEAGVRPLLHTTLLDVASDGRHIDGIRVLTKGGVLLLRAGVFVDASGDMDALKQAGARFLELGDGEALQPATMMFRFGPIDFERFGALSKAELSAFAAQGYAQGQLARAALHSSRDPYSDDGWFNISRLGIDATDPMALGAAEIEGRRQAWKAAWFLANAVPGCEKGRLRAFATQVGVRETRRLEGDHVLTAQELLEPVQFSDAIAAGAYPIDIHPATGGALHYVPMDADHAYQIPYRSLIPSMLDNALGIGRGISASHEALAAIRVMTISMAVGQAAGIAAAMAARAAEGGMGAQVRAVKVPALREALVRGGAVLA
jgi:hypothetical protein